MPPLSIKAVLARTGIDPELIEDVSFAQSYASGEAPCIGRWAALQAGLPVSVPGFQLDRRCGGGLQAIITAAMMVQTGAADVVLAGGVESMSNVEHYTTSMRWGARSGNQFLYDRLDRGRERSQPEWRFGKISGMIETAENVAEQFGITRDEADAYAARSHQRAAAAWAAGLFDDEVVPVEVPQRRGDPVTVEQGRGRPARLHARVAQQAPHDHAGRHRHGRQRQPAERRGRGLPRCRRGQARRTRAGAARLPGRLGRSRVRAGHDGHRASPGRGTAVRPDRTRLQLDRPGRAERGVRRRRYSPCLSGWGWNDPDKLNVNGSGISLGHPIGATGARILATGLRELRRRDGRYLLETMCVGGGQGVAAIFEGAR